MSGFALHTRIVLRNTEGVIAEAKAGDVVTTAMSSGPEGPNRHGEEETCVGEVASRRGQEEEQDDAVRRDDRTSNSASNTPTPKTMSTCSGRTGGLYTKEMQEELANEIGGAICWVVRGKHDPNVFMLHVPPYVQKMYHTHLRKLFALVETKVENQ